MNASLSCFYKTNFEFSFANFAFDMRAQKLPMIVKQVRYTSVMYVRKKKHWNQWLS